MAWNKFGGVVMSCDLHVRNRTIDKLVFQYEFLNEAGAVCLGCIVRALARLVVTFVHDFLCVCLYLNTNSRLLDV